MKKNVLNSDVLAAVLYYTKLDVISSNLILLCRGIRQTKNKCPLLECFPGADSITITNSVADSRDILKSWDILKESDDSRTYTIPTDACNYIEKVILPSFSEKEREELTRAAQYIAKIIETA